MAQATRITHILTLLAELQQSSTVEMSLSAWQTALPAQPELATVGATLSPLALRLLGQLSLSPEPLMGTELATALSVTRGGISRLARRLRTQGLIDQVTGSADRKARYFSLRPDGATLAAIIVARQQNQELARQALLATIGKKELKAIERFLRQVVELETKTTGQ